MRGANTNYKDIFVIDTSFVLAYLMPDEAARNVEEMFSEFEENKVSFISPNLLIYETMNGLRSAVVQKRHTPEGAQLLLDSFLDMGISFMQVDEKEVLDLALDKGITVYDASYVWLAKSQNIELLTLDVKLARVLE